MAQSGNFFAKFSQDLELIYAKYSRSFDGSAELSLKACDLRENVKQIENIRLENIRSQKCEWSQVEPNQDSSSQDSCLANSSYSSDDEDHGLISYHKDEETGHVFTTPVGSSDEETTSSPSYKSDDILGWESGCSESAEAYQMANNKDPDLFVERSDKLARTKPSPASKAVSLKPSPSKDGNNSPCHDAGGTVPYIYNNMETSPSSYDSTALACTQVRAHRRKRSARNTTNEDKTSDAQIGIDVGSLREYSPCDKMCSALLTAVHKFQNTVSNVLLLSLNNHKPSQEQDLPSALSEKQNYEKCFEKISQSLHGKQKFLDDQERDQCNFKLRKSLDFQQPMCVVEKLFARPKGSADDSFIKMASRQFLNTTDIQCSADENNNLRQTRSGVLSTPTITSLGKSNGRVRLAVHNTNHRSSMLTEASPDEGVSSPGVNGGDLFCDAKRSGTCWRSRSTSHRDSPVENSRHEPDRSVTSQRHGQKNSLDPRLESPRAILPLQSDWGVSVGDDVKPSWRTIRNKVPTINGVISLDSETTRETQCCTPLQSSPSSEDTNEPKSLSSRSPLLTCRQDRGMISPGVESCGTGRRSVPLRATPGCDNVMRISEVSLGLLSQTSTPDKWTDWRVDERKLETRLSPDPDTFFKPRKIPQPRRSLMPPANLTPGDSTPGDSSPGDSTPSLIRPLSSSQREQSAGRTSARALETRERGRPTGIHDDHAGGSRRRLYSPRVGRTSEVPASEPVNETGGRKTAPRTPQGCSRLSGKRFDFVSSNDEYPRSPHSLKIKNTPRRNSTGCHPYARYSPSSRRESPSLASPLQALRILSPSSCSDESARWSTLRHATTRGGKLPVVRYNETKSEKPRLLSRKEKRLRIKKNDFDHTEEECEGTHECSQGNCTKRFCFNCSMDCS